VSGETRGLTISTARHRNQPNQPVMPQWHPNLKGQSWIDPIIHNHLEKGDINVLGGGAQTIEVNSPIGNLGEGPT
jgi:hypothetical protein